MLADLVSPRVDSWFLDDTYCALWWARHEFGEGACLLSCLSHLQAFTLMAKLLPVLVTFLIALIRVPEVV